MTSKTPGRTPARLKPNQMSPGFHIQLVSTQLSKSANCQGKVLKQGTTTYIKLSFFKQTENWYITNCITVEFVDEVDQLNRFEMAFV